MRRPCLVDWNCQLMPDMHGTIMRPEMSAEVIRFLSERFGIRRYCAMPTFDATQQSVPQHLIERDRSLLRLKDQQLPRGIQIKAFTRVRLTQGISDEPGLSRLRIPGTDYLSLFLPLQPYADWMDLELNRLLYHRGFDLLLTSFELCPILYSKEILHRLLRVERAAFQFSYRSLSEKTICQMIAQLLMQGRIVLLGTGIDCIEKAGRYEWEYYLSCARKNLTSVLFEQLLIQNHAFPKLLK